MPLLWHTLPFLQGLMSLSHRRPSNPKKQSHLNTPVDSFKHEPCLHGSFSHGSISKLTKNKLSSIFSGLFFKKWIAYQFRSLFQWKRVCSYIYNHCFPSCMLNHFRMGCFDHIYDVLWPFRFRMLIQWSPLGIGKCIYVVQCPECMLNYFDSLLKCMGQVF